MNTTMCFISNSYSRTHAFKTIITGKPGYSLARESIAILCREVFFRRVSHSQTPLPTDSFFYTEKPLGTQKKKSHKEKEAFTHNFFPRRNFSTEKVLHTQMFLQKHTSTQKHIFYTESFFTTSKIVIFT